MSGDSEDERVFVLDEPMPLSVAARRDLEHVLTQLLGRKVWVLAESSTSAPDTQPFE